MYNECTYIVYTEVKVSLTNTSRSILANFPLKNGAIRTVEQSKLNHQSQMKWFWLKMVPLGQSTL
jgi:hypothetical protein